MTEVVSQPEPVSQPGDASKPEPAAAARGSCSSWPSSSASPLLIGIAALLVNINTHKQEAQTTVVQGRGRRGR